jgi:hypothetical protein
MQTILVVVAMNLTQVLSVSFHGFKSQAICEEAAKTVQAASAGRMVSTTCMPAK